MAILLGSLKVHQGEGKSGSIIGKVMLLHDFQRDGCWDAVNKGTYKGVCVHISVWVSAHVCVQLCVQMCVHMYVCSCGAQILLTLFFETECLTDVELVTEVRVDNH